MTANITRETLESFLQCRYKAHLQMGLEQGHPTDYARLMHELRERVRQAATGWLLARHRNGVVLRGVPLTPNLLHQGADLLLDATIEGEGLSVRFDALEKRTGSSGLGHHYVPVLFHEDAKTGREQRLLLEILGLLLAEVQGKEPGWGVLIHGRDCQVHRLNLSTGVGRARRLLQSIREMRAISIPPRLTLNSHCQVCEFRRGCLAEATAKDDLSLLRGISEKEIGKYARRGISTVTQLSFTFRARRERPKGQQQNHSHPLQALAIREKKIHVLGSLTLPDSATRLYLDIEGDPDRGFDYLLGVIVVTPGGEQRHSFWADSPAEETRLLEQFLELVNLHPDAVLYSYGSYEAAFLRRVGRASGKEEEVRKALERMCNVLSVIRGRAYFPVYSNSLKDVAGQLEFAWSDPDASGLQSVVWRRRWEETGSAAWKEKLLTYNLEDCAALRMVSEMLHAISSDQPAGVESLDGHEVKRVEQTVQGRMHGWNESIHALPDFAYVHERASFDYLRDRVCIRTGRIMKKVRKRRMRWKKNRRVNREVEITCPSCPACGGTNLTRHPNRSLARLAFDLRITRSGSGEE